MGAENAKYGLGHNACGLVLCRNELLLRFFALKGSPFLFSVDLSRFVVSYYLCVIDHLFMPCSRYRAITDNVKSWNIEVDFCDSIVVHVINIFACITFHFSIASCSEAEAFPHRKRHVSSLQPLNLILNGTCGLSPSQNGTTVSFPVYLRFSPVLLHWMRR